MALRGPSAQSTAGSSTPDIETVDTGDDYVHVRFRPADAFDEIRTPDPAAEVAREVAEGAEVRMGRGEGRLGGPERPREHAR